MKPTTIELCCGAGGEALGLARAGFRHLALVDHEADACATLSANRPDWPVVHADMKTWDGRPYRNTVDLLAGGLPCPPFTVAGEQRGPHDERDLFPSMLRLVEEVRPNAVMIENVPGFLAPRFAAYRERLVGAFSRLGYAVTWRVFSAADFGVPQRRERVIIVAMKRALMPNFAWPDQVANLPPPVGDVLFDLMSARGWKGAARWRRQAQGLAPTIVGGSKKHGGPDLGPTRSRAAWAGLGVDGRSIANEAPDPKFTGMPRLTLEMVARLQGFPDHWQFVGNKTSRYRQIGNAMPPAFAAAIARSIRVALARAPLIEGSSRRVS